MGHEIPAIMIVLIVTGYIVIACQFFMAARHTQQSEGRKALFLLVGIFVLCALCGYLPRLWLIPSVFEVSLHVALIIATWWFVFTNQAALIIKALR